MPDPLLTCPLPWGARRQSVLEPHATPACEQQSAFAKNKAKKKERHAWAAREKLTAFAGFALCVHTCVCAYIYIYIYMYIYIYGFAVCVCVCMDLRCVCIHTHTHTHTYIHTYIHKGYLYSLQTLLGLRNGLHSYLWLRVRGRLRRRLLRGCGQTAFSLPLYPCNPCRGLSLLSSQHMELYVYAHKCVCVCVSERER